jgi:hypothetical protein
MRTLFNQLKTRRSLCSGFQKIDDDRIAELIYASRLKKLSATSEKAYSTQNHPTEEK